MFELGNVVVRVEHVDVEQQFTRVLSIGGQDLHLVDVALLSIERFQQAQTELIFGLEVDNREGAIVGLVQRYEPILQLILRVQVRSRWKRTDLADVGAFREADLKRRHGKARLIVVDVVDDDVQ